MSRDHQDPTMPKAHPDELLAAYVEGSASAEQRSLAEAHLESCAVCREEVRFAQAGRTALRSLPELAPPGVASRLPLPEPVPDGAGVADLDARRRRRAMRWQRATWAAGVAAAASVATVLIVHSLGGGGAKQSATSAMAPAAPRGEPALISGHTDYTAQSLAALADRLAAQKRSFAISQGNPALQPFPSSQEHTGSPAHPAESPLACAQAAAGLPSDAQATYLESATYQGTPAIVAAFITNAGTSRASLLTVAAARDGCRPLDAVSVAF